jgi:hypothetical protein
VVLDPGLSCAATVMVSGIGAPGYTCGIYLCMHPYQYFVLHDILYVCVLCVCVCYMNIVYYDTVP